MYVYIHMTDVYYEAFICQFYIVLLWKPFYFESLEAQNW